MFDFFKKKRKDESKINDDDKNMNYSETDFNQLLKSHIDKIPSIDSIPYNNTMNIVDTEDLNVSIKKTSKSTYFIVGQKDRNGILIQSYLPYTPIFS